MAATYQEGIDNIAQLEDGDGLSKDDAKKLETIRDKVLAQVTGTPKVSSEQRPSGKLPGWGQVVEVCTSEDSPLGSIA